MPQETITFDRIMIAAPKSGSGKTMLTCALLQALKEDGLQPVSFKCGPDYIDPMFHERVLEIPSRNLDTFFTGEKETAALLARGRATGSIAVLEGVMGLFDGLGGIRPEGSSYHLAEVTNTPILLVVDAKGMSRSVIPLILGFLSYDTKHLIRGVILNRMSEASYEALKPLLEKELPVPVFGYLPQSASLHIESRHLGLLRPDELSDLKARLKNAADELRKTVRLDALLRTAEAAPELSFHPKDVRPKSPLSKNSGQNDSLTKDSGQRKTGLTGGREAGPVIAVARDEAFCFYYEDNLRLLRENGARLTFFSPLRDKRLPEKTAALLLGGGYPELHAKALSANSDMREAIKAAFLAGMPLVAECGGFMYLHNAIVDENGISHPMTGIVNAVCSDQRRLVRFGYVELTEKTSRFLPEGQSIRGHEFHYYDSTDNGTACLARKPVTGKTWTCVIEGDNFWLGFPHLYYPSNPAFAERFVQMAEVFRTGKR